MKLKKIYLLVALYVVVLLIETVFVVPYDKVTIYVSKQNVPHSEISAGGYDTIFYISEYGRAQINMDTERVVKINGQRLTTTILITTAIFALLFYLSLKHKSELEKKQSELEKENNETVNENSEPENEDNDYYQFRLFDNVLTRPEFDINKFIFADSDTLKKALDKYEDDMERYVTKKLLIELNIKK